MAQSLFLPLVRRRATIAPGGTVVLESLPAVSTKLVNYLFSLYESGGNKIKVFKLLVYVDDNGDVRDQLFSRNGGLAAEVSSDLVSGQIEVAITNLEANPIIVNLERSRL